MEEVHRLRVSAVLAADADLQAGPGGAALDDRDLHQAPHALAVDRLERGPTATGRPVQLELRENWVQFTLLVIVNVCVGSLVGLVSPEHTTVPLIGSETFCLTSDLVVFSFILAFGLTKVLTNLAAGALTSRFRRKQLLVTSWLLGIPVPSPSPGRPHGTGSSPPTLCSVSTRA